MIKLDDVAQLAGVSKGTASRVLNNRGYISEKTRAKVAKAMSELNYYPNENARNLLKQRTGVVGVVVPTITYPYYSELISQIEHHLSEHDYKMLLCNNAFNADGKIDYIQMLSKNRVEGVILFNYEVQPQDYESLSFPIVSIDRFVRDSYSLISSNHEQGGSLAAQHLIGCGCKHVIQVGGSFEEKTPWNIRHIVFQKLMQEHGIDCITYEQSADAHDYHDYRMIALKLLKDHPGTDGFFCNDLCATAVLNAAATLHISVPKQLKVVGYDGSLVSEIATPSITSIRQDSGKIAAAACDTLFQLIEDPDASPCSITVAVKLVERESTRCG